MNNYNSGGNNSTDNSTKKDDLASLFLPDILHPLPSNNIKQEDINFDDSLMNQNFNLNMMDSHINHYSNYIPIEASAPVLNNKNYPLVDYDMNYNEDLQKFNQFHLPFRLYDQQLQQQQIQPVQQQQQPQIQPVQQPIQPVELIELEPVPAKKKAKPSPTPNIMIDYKMSKLTNLLDFTPIPENEEFKILDDSNNEIKLNMTGFMNGKFFTNDSDNNNYIQLNPNESGSNSKIDPKVISCYRRNFIQLSLNLNLSNFQNDSNKILKLQTTEYGYIITRVIKWFKIDISAKTVSNNPRLVPIIITDDEDKVSSVKNHSNDYVIPDPIKSSSYIIPINKINLENNTFNNYYTIKKLQFKNATPHNGNFTFQNYYNLKIKLSAVVADMYYDDYVDKNQELNIDDKNEFTLMELVSKPIIVRGRNPSFYYERKDILIKGRNLNLKSSFQDSDAIEIDSNIESNNDFDDASSEDLPIGNDKSLPPLMYSALQSKNSNNNKLINQSNNKYKYFPILNVYYLPPINVVYFPHGAHQHKLSNSNLNLDQNKIDLNDKQMVRKNSNVYFK